MDNNPILQPVTPSTPSRLLTQVKIFCLSDYDRNYLQKYTKDFPCPDQANLEDLIPYVSQLIGKFPNHYRSNLISLSMNPHANAFALIRNCPGDNVGFSAEYFQLATAMAMGGRPMAQMNEGNEQIIQRIKPQKDDAYARTSSAYAVSLDYHGDDFGSSIFRNAWTIPYIKRRPETGPKTYMADMRLVCESIRQSGRQGIIEVARRNKVIPLYPESQRKGPLVDSVGPSHFIISGPEGAEYINAEFIGDTVIIPDDNVDDKNVVELAIEVIFEHIKKVAVMVDLKERDMALFSNQRGFHARGPFPDGYDPETDTLREITRIHMVMDPWHSRNVPTHLI